MTTLEQRESAMSKEEFEDELGLLEEIIENIPHMVFLKDATDLRFVRFNRAGEELLGYSRHEMIGRSDYDFFPAWQADGYTSRDREVLTGGRLVEIHAEAIETRSRGRRMLHTKKIPILDSAGNPRYLLGISEDITERYQREHVLLKARDEADRLDAERDAVVSRLLSMIDHRSLDVWFQPIADLADGSLVGAEALARFHAEPSRPPDHWFRQAAEVGLAVRLEIAAVELALERLDELPPEVFLSVNLSPPTLVSDALRDVVEGVPGNRLVLELTEHDRVDDYGVLEEKIDDIRQFGTKIAVDDAGAGWSSMQHIVRIRPEIIKLDIELTRGIESNPAQRAMAAALVAFAREIDSTVVAEGIETPQELETLRTLGVPLGQGYLVGRPQRLPLTGVGPLSR